MKDKMNQIIQNPNDQSNQKNFDIKNLNDKNFNSHEQYDQSEGLNNKQNNNNIKGLEFINNNKLLLKICTKTATEEDINIWGKQNNISSDNLEKTMKTLIKTYDDNSQKMEYELNKQSNPNEKIIVRLHYILKSLNTLTNEVKSIINEIE